MSIAMNGLIEDNFTSGETIPKPQKKRQKADPMDTLIECIWDFVDAQYEDTEVTDSDLLVAKKRFKHALQYIIISTMEQYDAKKQV